MAFFNGSGLADAPIAAARRVGAASRGPLVIGAAACFVRTMTGAGGPMRGPLAPLRAAFLMLLGHMRQVAGAGAAAEATRPRALVAPPERSGL